MAGTATRLMLFAVLSVAGCSQDLSIDWQPEGAPGGGPTGSFEVPDLGDGPNFGDARDGDLVVGGDVTVNACTAILAVSGSTLSIDTDLALTSGDAVLVLQVQEELSAADTRLSAFDPGSAGSHELATVTASTGTELTVNGDPSWLEVTSPARAQVCHVPQFATVTVDANGRILPLAWDGDDHGVVAFLAHEVVLDGEIDASEAGFRGGAVSARSLLDSILDIDTLDPTRAGGKGEGVHGPSFGWHGSGRMGTAGGGGNAREAGGGGGGNAAAGGNGGMQADGQGNVPETQGIGGAAILGPRLLVLGGGGGGGHEGANNGVNNGVGTTGAPGGGIVRIAAAQISGAGAVRANGGSVGPNDRAGSGGAGAAGSIWIESTSSIDIALIEARGGVGGDSVDDNGTDLRGPGGGGSGGRVLSTPTTAVVDVSGGANGINTTTGGLPHAASVGGIGNVEAL